jgi:hypothetical protein
VSAPNTERVVVAPEQITELLDDVLNTGVLASAVIVTV